MHKASTEPSVEANETRAVPHSAPNRAPAASVSTVAAGMDSAVTTTYAAEKARNVAAGCRPR